MNTNPNAKVIVCYGDSNTWGDKPSKDGRHPANIRWVGVLQDALGNGYEVVNEGLPGRTFIAQDPEKPFRTGITHLKSILGTNSPTDIITVMLGTNDMKIAYGLTAEAITDHLDQTIKFIAAEQNNKNIKIIVICPPPVVLPKNVELDPRMVNAPALSQELPQLYKAVADKNACAFIDAGEFINLEHTDGYHLEAEHHKMLGDKVAAVVKSFSL